MEIITILFRTYEALKNGEEISFSRPGMFLLLWLLVPLCVVLFISYFSDVRILRAFKQRKQPRGVYTAYTFLSSIMIVSLIAMAAGPEIKTYEPQRITSKEDCVFIVDSTGSMDARPSVEGGSQMDLARMVIREVIRNVGCERFQIFAFERLAFDISMMTSNVEHLLDTADRGLYAGVIPAGGFPGFSKASLPNALSVVARKKLEDSDYADVYHAIVISDGWLSNQERSDGMMQFATEKLNEAGITVVSVGVGSPSGWRIPIYDEEGNFTGKYKKELRNDALSILDEEVMRQIAKDTGGEYFRYDNTEGLVTYLNSDLEDRHLEPETQRKATTEDIGLIFMLPFTLALLALLTFYRKFY